MAANNLQINVNVGGNALSQLQKVQQQIKSTDNAVKGSARGYTVFGAAADKSTDKARRFAQAGIQQAGFQLGDFAVQLQNGTHFLTAFGQQGSQLLGVFGAVGAVLGAVVAVGAAVGTVLLKMRDTAGTLTEELDELEGSIKDLSDFALTNEERFDKLKDKYGEVTGEVTKLFEAQKQLAQFELQNQLAKTITALKDELEVVDDLTRSQDLAARKENARSNERVQAQRSLRKAIGEVANEFDISRQQAEQLGMAFSRLNELDPFAQATEAAKEVQSIFDIITTKSFKDMSVAEREAAENLLRLKDVMLEVGNTNALIASEAVNAIGLSAEQTEALANGIASSMGNSFAGIVKGTESVKDAFRNMAMSIVDQLLQVLVVQRLVGGISTGLQTAFPNVFKEAAIGGSVQKGQPTIVGERGRELFIPASSGSIVPNDKLSDGSGVVVNQTINVSTGVQQTVRTEIAGLMPQIAQATKSAVADARMRGGSYAKAFGG